VFLCIVEQRCNHHEEGGNLICLAGVEGLRRGTGYATSFEVSNRKAASRQKKKLKINWARQRQKHALKLNSGRLNEGRLLKRKTDFRDSRMPK
jgi:hypothetical protein